MGTFRLHYKNKPYRFHGAAWHSETQEKFVLYENLYPNELGPMWVRPYDLFFENVELNGATIPRFREVPLKIESFSSLSAGLWTRLSPLVDSVFGALSFEEVEARLASQKDVLILLGTFEGDVVGFKIGYGIDSAFYSWLGGVREDRRGLGVGGELMGAQHSWASSHGYRSIVTKTLSQWSGMLGLNLKEGFQITGTEESVRGLKILMKKTF